MDSLDLIGKEINLTNSSLSTDDILDIQPISENTENITSSENVNNVIENSNEISEPEEQCTALVELKPRGLLVAQTMFKKSIRISIKSFLISLSLGFLNLFF